jgi:hypothetical protein
MINLTDLKCLENTLYDITILQYFSGLDTFISLFVGRTEFLIFYHNFLCYSTIRIVSVTQVLIVTYILLTDLKKCAA